MRYATLLALLLFFGVSKISYAQSSGGFRRPSEPAHDERPMSSGNPQIDQAAAKASAQKGQNQSSASAVNSLALQRDAEELAKLASAIPSDVEQTTKGILPKDLDERLKRIEKLAKHLRSGINH